jgi:hypothetical protein
VIKYTFVLISGGPGKYDPKDPERHDTSWASYVTPPLLLAGRGGFAKSDEAVVWYVYRPAYVARWDDDVKNPHKIDFIAKAVKDVQGKGFKSYVDLIEGRAREKAWTLSWLDSAIDLWSQIRTLRHPISRTWYWGHAKDDLWLSLDHTGAGVAVQPDSTAVLQSAGITVRQKDLQALFLQNDPTRVHRFIGCNTQTFANTWAQTFKVYAEGVQGKVNFESIFSAESYGEPKLSEGASRTPIKP